MPRASATALGTEASTVSPSIISHVACFMVTMLPFSNSTIGQPPTCSLLRSHAHGAEQAVDVLADQLSLRRGRNSRAFLEYQSLGGNMFF